MQPIESAKFINLKACNATDETLMLLLSGKNQKESLFLTIPFKKACPNLKELSIDQCYAITDKTFEYIAKCPKLEVQISNYIETQS